MMSSPSPPMYWSLPDAAFEPVVAAIAVEGVVALAGDEGVGLVGAAQEDVVGAGVAQVVRLDSGGRRIVAQHQRGEDASAGRIVRAEARVPLLGLVDLEDEAGRREHVRGQMAGVGVEADHLGEGVVLHFGQQMQPVEPLQVVEPVAVLQLLQLDLEDEVEGRAQHAAERHDLFGEAADPEIDVVEAAQRAAGVDAGGVEEGQAVGIEAASAAASVGTMVSPKLVPKISAMAASRLPSSVVSAGDQRVRAVGGDEVDDRSLVLEVAGEVDPARIGPAVPRRGWLASKKSRRAAFSDGTPASRPRARLMVARSSGRPSRLLRSALVTNSSISLPTCRVMPRMMLPAATLSATVCAAGSRTRPD